MAVRMPLRLASAMTDVLSELPVLLTLLFRLSVVHVARMTHSSACLESMASLKLRNDMLFTDVHVDNNLLSISIQSRWLICPNALYSPSFLIFLSFLHF